MPRGQAIPVTHARLAWLRQHYGRMSPPELALAFGARFGEVVDAESLARFARRHGIMKKANGGRFAAGNQPWNKGRAGWAAPGRALQTRFRPGAVPHTTVPIGSYRQVRDGYWIVKVSDHDPARADASNARLRDWRYVHHLVYANHHGPIPPGHIVLLIDGDPDHCQDPDNLICVSRAVQSRLNQMGFPDLPPDRDLRRAAIAEATLRQAAHDRARDLGMGLRERRRLLGGGSPFPARDADGERRLRASQFQPGEGPAR